MVRLPIVLIILTATSFNIDLAFACQCDYQTEKQQLIKSANVFLIAVSETTKYKVTADIIKSYKTKVSKKVEILYPKKAKCFDKPISDLSAGKTYLVTTSRYSWPSDPSQPGYIKSKLCDLHKEESTAKDLIKWLESEEFQRQSNEKK